MRCLARPRSSTSWSSTRPMFTPPPPSPPLTGAIIFRNTVHSSIIKLQYSAYYSYFERKSGAIILVLKDAVPPPTRTRKATIATCRAVCFVSIHHASSRGFGAFRGSTLRSRDGGRIVDAYPCVTGGVGLAVRLDLHLHTKRGLVVRHRWYAV